MKKLLSVLTAVVCMVAVLGITSANAKPSFREGEIYVRRTNPETEVFESWDSNGAEVIQPSAADEEILNTPTVAKLEAAVAGFPSSSKYDVVILGTHFFDGSLNDPAATEVGFQITCDKIISGVKVAAVHWVGADDYEIIDADSVDVAAHTAYFTNETGSPWLVYVYKAKSTSTSSSGSSATTTTTTTPAISVVNTAAK